MAVRRAIWPRSCGHSGSRRDDAHEPRRSRGTVTREGTRRLFDLMHGNTETRVLILGSATGPGPAAAVTCKGFTEYHRAGRDVGGHPPPNPTPAAARRELTSLWRACYIVHSRASVRLHSLPGCADQARVGGREAAH